MKILVFRKKVLIAVAAAAVVAVCAVVFSGSLSASVQTAAAQSRRLPIYSVKRDDNKASISFDAAWGNEDTQQLIDVLAKYQVKATFFVVGGWVDKYPESVKALADAGHEVMNHSDTHPYMTKLSSQGMLDEVNACADKVEKVTGVRPKLFRPPYGDYNDTLIRTLSENGFYGIQWSVDSLDWKELPASEITQRVTSKIESGSIVLFHNAAKHTPEALPGILEAIAAKGIELVPISQLIYTENYKIDHTGQQYAVEAPPPDSAATGATQLRKRSKEW